MSNRAADGRRIGVALAIAFVLFVQGVLGALAGAAHAASMPLDAFGNPLCITSSAGQDKSGHDPASMPSCCTLACHAPVSLLPDRALETPALTLGWIDAGGLLPQPLLLTFRSGHEPVIPRAPPVGPFAA